MLKVQYPMQFSGAPRDISTALRERMVVVQQYN